MIMNYSNMLTHTTSYPGLYPTLMTIWAVSCHTNPTPGSPLLVFCTMTVGPLATVYILPAGHRLDQPPVGTGTGMPASKHSLCQVCARHILLSKISSEHSIAYHADSLRGCQDSRQRQTVLWCSRDASTHSTNSREPGTILYASFIEETSTSIWVREGMKLKR